MKDIDKIFDEGLCSLEEKVKMLQEQLVEMIGNYEAKKVYIEKKQQQKNFFVFLNKENEKNEEEIDYTNLSDEELDEVK